MVLTILMLIIKMNNILFIGANDMNEINSYVHTYRNGIFIEAIPDVFKKLEYKLNEANMKCGVNYKAVNALVTSMKDQEYQFNVFSNGGASSSIFKPNSDKWVWPHVYQVDTIKLISTTVEHIINEESWNYENYDVVLDVQGAELEVLKGFGKHLQQVKKITTEISTEKFYENGVLFSELHDFLVNSGFQIEAQPTSTHCDVVYTRKA